MFKKRARKGTIKHAEPNVDVNDSSTTLIKPKKRKLENQQQIENLTLQMEENIDDLKTNLSLEDQRMDDLHQNDSQDAFYEDTIPVIPKVEKKPKDVGLSLEYNSYIDVDDELDLIVLKRQGISVQAKQIETIKLDYIIEQIESLECGLQSEVYTSETLAAQLEHDFDLVKSTNVELSFTDNYFIDTQKMAAQLNLLIPQKIEVNYLVQLVNEVTHHRIKSRMNEVLLKLKSLLNPTEFNKFENEYKLPVESNKYFYHYAFAKKQFEEMPLIFNKEYRTVWEYLFTIEYCYTILFLKIEDINELASFSGAHISWIPSNLKESTNLLFFIEPFPCAYFLDYLSMVLTCVNYKRSSASLDNFVDDIFVFPAGWFKDEYYFTLEEILGRVESGYYSNSILAKLKE